MEVNDQLSRYQAEYYVETVHDAFVNVQRLLNDYNFAINSITDAIAEEKVYRKQTKKQRMRKFGAVLLLLIGIINILVTIALLAFTGYIAYNWQTGETLPYISDVATYVTDFVKANVEVLSDPLYLTIAGGVVYLVFLIITCKIFSRRRKVGRKLNIKKAKKKLKAKIKRAESLTAVLTTYPIIYEEINKVLVRTKRHPLGKIILSVEDKKAIDDVKHFCACSEEATKTYKTKENI